MKLRLALLTTDLGFRFHVSATTVSSIFITWVKLMSKELSVLIVWSSRQQVKKTLPLCFRKLYPKVRCIIDCFECFTETPSGLDVAATLWSEYKHHCTFKVLVAISPNGAISCFTMLWRKGIRYFCGEKLDFWTWSNPMMKSWQTEGLRSEKTWWCTWQHYAYHLAVHHLCSCYQGMLKKHRTLQMSGPMWSKPSDGLKFFFS